MNYVWIGFFVLVAALLALDLGVLNRSHHVIGFKEASRWTALWITIGVSFGGVVYLIFENHWFGISLTHQSPLVSDGIEALTLYITGYLLEKSLSIDNIFVIALVFERFGVARQYRHRVLFWGILGALVMRAVMIFGGIWLIERFDWIFYFFGAWLIWQGISSVRGGDDDEVDPEKGLVFRLASRVMPMRGGDHHGKFVTREGGFAFTTLALCLVVIEWTDVAFAMDSVPAVLAVTTEPFLVFTSNIFAILGLRSLYFMLDGMMAEFEVLAYALAAILVFIGLKMILHNFVHVPNLVSLGVIAGILVLAIVGERLIRSRKPKSEGQEQGD
ncbi:MAG: TerC/Alx family metal homeostasis membrane protein [Myxococcales bacterium]|nr:TerC/Alx family metal homeostasis membrane protein [Myxococcales bacterium]